MTTLTVVDGYRPNESRTKAIARRLRSELAAIEISGSEAARLCGVTQPWMSRRLRGATGLDVEDLDMICRKLRLSFDYIVTGIKPLPGTDGTPNSDLLLPRLDSNQQPFGEYPDLELAAAVGV